eukprot:123861-Karenia_brevis.AAC.1
MTAQLSKGCWAVEAPKTGMLKYSQGPSRDAYCKLASFFSNAWPPLTEGAVVLQQSAHDHHALCRHQ